MSDQTQNVSENDIRADEAVNENIEKVNAVNEQAFETAEAAAEKNDPADHFRLSDMGAGSVLSAADSRSASRRCYL